MTRLDADAEDCMCVEVTVTFLRMDCAPSEPAPELPEGFSVRRLPVCPVALYRQLYNNVGGPWLWWLRRVMADRDLARHLARRAISIHLAEMGGEVVGFYELDTGHWPAANLSYFGLLPDAIGRGLGRAFLRHAVDTAFGMGARVMTVNTCTADHPRALANYKRVGFREIRKVDEVWDIPRRLGLVVPAHMQQRP
jgi:GNAT superfamily N-acetyltransferase